MTTADRTLPANLEAERAVLGAILLHNESYPLATANVSSGDFFRDAHRRIFDAMIALATAGDAIDLVTIKEALGKIGDLDACGGPAYIAALVDGVPRSMNVEHYARIVKDKARLRALIVAATMLLSRAYDGEESASTIADDVTRDLLATVDTSGGAAVKAADEMMAYVMSLEDDAKAGPRAPMATGFLDLDEMLDGGVRLGDLVVVAGRPSMGKSSLVLGMAKGVAAAGYPAAMLSLEMRARVLAERLVSWGARIDGRRMRGRFLGEHDWGRISQAVGEAADLPLYLLDSASSLVEVAAWAQRLKAEYGVKVIVVDYLQLLLPERRSSSREQDVAALSAGLKRIARTQDLAVVAVSALNRAPEGRKDNRPKLGDLRESGALEYDADVALLIHRQELYDDAAETHGIAEIIVAKNKEGATGTVKLAFLAVFDGCFENLAQGTV